MPVNWHRLARNVDNLVDAQWGESVTLKPMSEASDLDPYAVDPTRAAVTVRGIVDKSKAVISTNQAGTQATADMMVSIKTSDVPDYIKQGDHVVLNERGQELEIVLAEPDAISRTKLHLVWVR